jgi:pimeloyl-ACP methyl ester carboxylesterase
MSEPVYPGAVAPERRRRIDSGDVSLAVYEWGDPDADPVVLSHGMFDHARGFDLFAPLLAERFRVVAYDARGHGESGWADSYLWPADVRDLVELLRSLGRKVHLVGHSRGGGLALDTATSAPDLVRSVVNMDGFGPPPEGFDMPIRKMGGGSTPERLAGYLDWRRSCVERPGWRPYASLEDLVSRRSDQNPRLSREWLRYFLFHGAREVEGGWVWKADPFAGRAFGPFRPEWIAPTWRLLQCPLLALIGSEADTWGPLPEPLLAERLSHAPVLERATVEAAGHFMHMEEPESTAAITLDFLAAS